MLKDFNTAVSCFLQVPADMPEAALRMLNRILDGVNWSGQRRHVAAKASWRQSLPWKKNTKQILECCFCCFFLLFGGKNISFILCDIFGFAFYLFVNGRNLTKRKKPRTHLYQTLLFRPRLIRSECALEIWCVKIHAPLFSIILFSKSTQQTNYCQICRKHLFFLKFWKH